MVLKCYKNIVARHMVLQSIKVNVVIHSGLDVLSGGFADFGAGIRLTSCWTGWSCNGWNCS